MTRSQIIMDFEKIDQELRKTLNSIEDQHNPPQIVETQTYKPEWEFHDFDIHDCFSYDNEEVIYLQGMEILGMKIQLRVNPNGRNQEHKGHLSAYMLFDHSMDEILGTTDFQFEFKMCVVNKINPNYLLGVKDSGIKTFDFKTSPYSWGRHSIATHEELKENGFVSNDGTDTVTVRLFARRQNYHLKVLDMEKKLKLLQIEKSRDEKYTKKDVNHV